MPEQSNNGQPRLIEVPVTREPGGRSGAASAVLALLLALAALGLAGYNFYLHREANQRVEAVIGGLDEQLNANGSALVRLTRLEKELVRIEQAEQGRQAELETRLTQALQAQQSSPETRTNDWVLAEVSYLLRLANQRIVIEGEVESALGLLQSADQVLQETQGLQTFELRQSLADDMARLAAVPRIDVEGVYLLLGSMTTQVNELVQNSPLMKPLTDKQVRSMRVDAGAPWWEPVRRLMDALALRLREMVIISRQSDPVRPMLVPEEVFYLRQNLVLKLQQAQLALLGGHQDIFDRSINDAYGWINEHFKKDDPLTVSMSSRLLKLKGMSITARLPDVSASLQIARRLAGGAPAEPPATEAVPIPQ